MLSASPLLQSEVVTGMGLRIELDHLHFTNVSAKCALLKGCAWISGTFWGVYACALAVAQPQIPMLCCSHSWQDEPFRGRGVACAGLAGVPGGRGSYPWQWKLPAQLS